jgi:predicted nuclease with RNAse H fold
VASPSPDIVGIDFSGANNAGKHIWITTGTESSGILQVSDCEQASDFFAVGTDRKAIHSQLVDWVGSLNNATVGIDFPFGVPKVVAEVVFQANSWTEFVNSPNWSGLNPEIFRQQCVNLSNSELRDTDAMHRADCPHSIRMYKQTFFGVRDILQPLLQRNVSIAPMVNNGNTIVLETYPAATLAQEDGLFAARYKNRTSTLDRRKHNVLSLSRLQDIDLSAVPDDRIIDDNCGDALDSLVAALSTFRASRNSSPFNIRPQTQIEGHIYV